MEGLVFGGNGYSLISSATNWAAGVGVSKSSLLQGSLLINFPIVLEDRLVAEVLDSTATMSLLIDFFIFKIVINNYYEKM